MELAENGLKRSFKARHLMMMSVGGVIGAGSFQVYSRIAFTSFAGFITGRTYWLAFLIGPASEAIGTAAEESFDAAWRDLPADYGHWKSVYIRGQMAFAEKHRDSKNARP